ncbi:hypothetical protein [Phyllobacterium sp. SYP-B3895]|nr:hypothetical protein [Phyllobacterium sp. SYP-B3895]
MNGLEPLPSTATLISEPLKYAPQYGGYCAGEVAHGAVPVNTDPEAF